MSDPAGSIRPPSTLKVPTPPRLRAFRERTPPSQKISKTDLARFQNSWNRLPHVVSGGLQKNFIAYIGKLRETRGARWEPDHAFYREAIAQAILFRAAQRIVRSEGFPAYRINIATYLVSYLSHRTGGRLRLDLVWATPVSRLRSGSVASGMVTRDRPTDSSECGGQERYRMVQERGLLVSSPTA